MNLISTFLLELERGEQTKPPLHFPHPSPSPSASRSLFVALYFLFADAVTRRQERITHNLTVCIQIFAFFPFVVLLIVTCTFYF